MSCRRMMPASTPPGLCVRDAKATTGRVPGRQISVSLGGFRADRFPSAVRISCERLPMNASSQVRFHRRICALGGVGAAKKLQKYDRVYKFSEILCSRGLAKARFYGIMIVQSGQRYSLLAHIGAEIQFLSVVSEWRGPKFRRGARACRFERRFTNGKRKPEKFHGDEL